ncbi:alpha/beta hydrolase, partial [Synechococcus sp.]
MLKRIAAGLLAGAAISVSALPVSAQPSPVRWNSGGAVWTTKFSDFNDFLKSKDAYSNERGLSSGLAASGWTAKEVQAGLSKTYNVDLVGVSRYLYSKDGVKFLQDQTRSYFPYWAQKATAVQALRSAIILASVDGKLSSAAIMKNLPVDFRLAD